MQVTQASLNNEDKYYIKWEVQSQDKSKFDQHSNNVIKKRFILSLLSAEFNVSISQRLVPLVVPRMLTVSIRPLFFLILSGRRKKERNLTHR